MISDKKIKRIKIGFYIVIIFGVLFAANRLDKTHFDTAQHSLNSIYNDRVVAQDIIYQLSSTFNDRHLLYISETFVDVSVAEVKKQDELIKALFSDFRNTLLTENEKKQLRYLEVNFSKLKEVESVEGNSNSMVLTDLKQKFLDINENLDALSKIQLSESRNLKAIGQKSLDSNDLLSITEIIIMGFFALALIVLIFYKGA
jgi:hypothetical protein